MSPLEQIQQQVRELPLEKQNEVLDFVSFLQQQQRAVQKRLKQHSLRQHPAFGSWCGRTVDGLDYQRTLRSECGERT